MTNQRTECEAGFDIFGQLRDAEAEKEFQAARMPLTRRRMRFVCAMTAPAYLAAIYADSLEISGSDLTEMLMARVAVAVVGMLPLALTFRKELSARLLGAACGLYMSALMVAEVYELVLKAEQVPFPQTPITVFAVLSFYLFLPPQVWQSLVAGTLGSIAYLAALLMLTDAPPGYVSNTTLLFALANGFGLYFSIRFGAAQRREHLALNELTHQAEIDALTGVYNRRRIMELGSREFHASQRYGYPCSLLLIDIDHFKTINDTHGHVTGDAVLVGLARRCVETLREVDLFGRIGGEEFIVFMPHAAIDQAVLAAERLKKAVSAIPFRAEEAKVDVTISIGVAELSVQSSSLDKLITAADTALYRAKQEGRNRVRSATGNPTALN